MDFDHVRGDKRKDLSHLKSCDPKVIVAEIALCELVCAVCHRVRTQSRLPPTKSKKKRWFLRKLEPFKAQPCADCGSSFPSVSMDFDHVRGVKLFRVSAMQGQAWDRVLAEIAKCDLVCANCHRIRTKLRGTATELMPTGS